MKDRNINLRQIAMFIGLLVLVVLIMDFNNRMAQLTRLRAQAEVVEARATEKMGTRVALETEIAYASSDEAVEEWARVQGHMIKPGDHPVVPLAVTQEAPLAEPTPMPSPEPVQNWEIWLAVFFE